jgi:hypothetical protein
MFDLVKLSIQEINTAVICNFLTTAALILIIADDFLN